MGIFERLKELKSEFREQNNGEEPSKLFITNADELEIEEQPATRIGSTLASEIIEKGVREALKDENGRCWFLGLEVNWDSDKTYVK